MRRADAYSELLALGRPVVETNEAAARLSVASETATKHLRALEDAGLVSRIRHGLWALDSDLAPAALAPYLTAPYPAYVSFWSALARHAMIEQIPARIEVASLDRSRVIETPFGSYSIHRLAPEIFTGYGGSPENGYLASPEKALFDTVYIRAPRGGAVRFPELTLPAGFDRGLFFEWTERIPRPRLRTLVVRGLESALKQAERYAADEY